MMGEQTARMAATDSVRVASSPVMSPGEHRLYVGLTVVAAIATAVFGWFWIKQSVFQVAYLAASVLLLFHIGSWFGRWTFLSLMRRPTPVPAIPGYKVAVVTTFVPDAESIEMLGQSLRAMRAMEYPHDTWVLDEGDSPDVAALCQQLGVRHYSRKKQDHLQATEGRFAKGPKYGN